MPHSLLAALLLAGLTLAASFQLLQSNGTTSWKYNDAGVDLTLTNWMLLAFDDSAWPSGVGPFGYGQPQSATVISFGSNPAAKNPTQYFRQSFVLSVGADTLTAAVVGLSASGGGAMYLNGVEIARRNMGPQEQIRYTDLALTGLAPPMDTAMQFFSFPPSLLLPGANQLAVELHAAKTTAANVNATFDAFLLLSDNVTVPAIVGSPFTTAISKSSMQVSWLTSGPCNTKLFYGGTMGVPIMTNVKVGASGPSTQHNITLTGLTTSIRYAYMVALDDATGTFSSPIVLAYNGRWSPVPSSTTSVPSHTRFVVLGEAGSGPAATAATVASSLNQFLNNDNGLLSSVWTLGNTGGYGLLSSFGPVTSIAATLPAFGAADALTSNDVTQTGPYFNMLSATPSTSGVASGNKSYYSFDWGSIHVCVLDSVGVDRSSTGPMLTWLAKDLAAVLAANTTQWLVAMFHNPPYTAGTDNSDTTQASIDMRANALPILEQYGVDLVLSGHTRAYERSVLLDSFYGASSSYSAGSNAVNTSLTGPYVKAPGLTPHGGCVYVVTGSSAGATETASLAKPYTAVHDAASAGALILDVSTAVLEVKFLNTAGAFVDRFQIQKYTVVAGVASVTPAPPTPTSTRSLTPTALPSATPSISVTQSLTASVSATPSLTPTISVTPTPSLSFGASASASDTVSVSPSPTPSTSPSFVRSASPSVTPSRTPSTSRSGSHTPSSSKCACGCSFLSCCSTADLPGMQSYCASKSSSSTSSTAVIGGAIGGGVGLIVISIAGACFMQRRKKQRAGLVATHSNVWEGTDTNPSTPSGGPSPSKQALVAKLQSNKVQPVKSSKLPLPVLTEELDADLGVKTVNVDGAGAAATATQAIPIPRSSPQTGTSPMNPMKRKLPPGLKVKGKLAPLRAATPTGGGAPSPATTPAARFLPKAPAKQLVPAKDSSSSDDDEAEDGIDAMFTAAQATPTPTPAPAHTSAPPPSESGDNSSPALSLVDTSFHAPTGMPSPILEASNEASQASKSGSSGKARAKDAAPTMPAFDLDGGFGMEF